MSDPLALSYRPRVFADVCGQKPVTAVLYAMVRRDRVPGALLFCGNRGSGKTTTARILAAALNCETEAGPPDQWPCGSCPSCKEIQSGASMDVLEVDAASNGGVAEIRKIRDLAQYASMRRYRVVLLDEVHSASRDAFNALLKVLEEPPERTVFVLITTEQGKILPTVRSRCMQFTFRRLPPAVIAERLEEICRQEGITAGPGLLHEIAERADGALRDAVMMLDQVARVGLADLGAFQALLGVSDTGPLLVSAMLEGHDRAFGQLEEILADCGAYVLIRSSLISCLRDLLVLASGGSVTTQGDALAIRQQLASRLDVVRIGAAMRIMWDLLTRAPRMDPRGSLDLAIALCTERLAPPRSQAPVTVTMNGHAPMTADRLAELSRQ